MEGDTTQLAGGALVERIRRQVDSFLEQFPELELATRQQEKCGEGGNPPSVEWLGREGNSDVPPESGCIFLGAENVVSDDELNLPVQIVLFEVDLPYREFLAIREAGTLSLELSQSLEVLVRVGGERFCRGRLILGEEGARVELIEGDVTENFCNRSPLRPTTHPESNSKEGENYECDIGSGSCPVGE